MQQASVAGATVMLPHFLSTFQDFTHLLAFPEVIVIPFWCVQVVTLLVQEIIFVLE